MTESQAVEKIGLIGFKIWYVKSKISADTCLSYAVFKIYLTDLPILIDLEICGFILHVLHSDTDLR